MINNVTLVGRLTKDPELKYTPSGVAVANFTLAVNRPFKTNGENEADFINITVWRKPAENAANFLKKGSLAGVTGSIQTRNYEGSDGKRVYVTEVVADRVQFLDSKGSGQTNNNQSKPQENTRVDEDPFAGNGQIDIDDSDLPF
jgi:single-strand DNA-binding protein